MQPPLVVTRFRLDRFSPMFKDPTKYGIANVRSYRGHQICYPFPEETLQRIAYFLDCDPPMAPETFREIKNMWQAVDTWKQLHPKSALTAEVTPSSLILRDRRAGYPLADYTYDGLARELYLALDGVHSDSFLLEWVRTKYPSAQYTADDVQRILNEFLTHDLVLCEDNLYLASPFCHWIIAGDVPKLGHGKDAGALSSLAETSQHARPAAAVVSDTAPDGVYYRALGDLHDSLVNDLYSRCLVG